MANPLELVANVDLDGTIADFDKAMHRDMLALQAPEEKPFDLGALSQEGEFLPHIEARMRLIKTTPGWWRELEVIPLGMTIVELMREAGYTINVLTKGPKSTVSAWSEKYEWCQKHLPDAQVTITQDKGLQYGRILFDDWPSYITRWLTWRPRGQVIMLDTPANRNFFHPRVTRVTGFEDLDKVRQVLAERAKDE